MRYCVVMGQQYNIPRACHWMQLNTPANLTLYSLDTHFDVSTLDSFENIVGKGEIASNEQFLLFPQCFPLNQITVSPICPYFWHHTLICHWNPKIGIWGKGLTSIFYQKRGAIHLQNFHTKIRTTVGGVCDTKLPIFSKWMDGQTSWFQSNQIKKIIFARV